MSDRVPLFSETPPALPAEFFSRDTLTVAQNLLGCNLMRWSKEHLCHLPFKIVETEAYTQDDPACHAYNRTTGRAATLYKAPGLAYVYLIYGMYDCLNVITEPAETAGAVLFRALEPPEGFDFKTNGPGRLTRALNITRAEFNECLLTDAQSPLYLAAGKPVPKRQMVTTTRIGIVKAADYPWRFYIKDNAWVSKK